MILQTTVSNNHRNAFLNSTDEIFKTDHCQFKIIILKISKELKSYTVFFQHNLEIKLEISNNNAFRKTSNMWKLNNILLKYPWIKEGMRGN